MLGRLAGGHATVRLRNLEGVIDLIRPLEDVDDTCHRELGRGQTDVKGEVLELRLLHRQRHVRARPTRSAALGILLELSLIHISEPTRPY